MLPFYFYIARDESGIPQSTKRKTAIPKAPVVGGYGFFHGSHIADLRHDAVSAK